MSMNAVLALHGLPRSAAAHALHVASLQWSSKLKHEVIALRSQSAAAHSWLCTHAQLAVQQKELYASATTVLIIALVPLPSRTTAAQPVMSTAVCITVYTMLLTFITVSQAPSVPASVLQLSAVACYQRALVGQSQR
eukprot:19159-Heterococcus_DN1.PRE.5